MAYVHEIKFFMKNGNLHAALFDNPPFFSDEFWIKNVTAQELQIDSLPPNVILEKKYKVEDLGIKPFYASKPLFDFIDKLAETAWKTGTKLL
ncbi:hypothetical protein [Nodularia spumigena]|uniref:hypothetical protein n=2 Tax=Nodularia spumigena TaxID=70799 RepID=UPI002330BFD8|nr:hypothetical protein [Nodularia spumigena]